MVKGGRIVLPYIGSTYPSIPSSPWLPNPDSLEHMRTANHVDNPYYSSITPHSNTEPLNHKIFYSIGHGILPFESNPPHFQY